MKKLVLCSLGIIEQDYDDSLNKLIQESEVAKLIENIEIEVKDKYEPVMPLRSRDEVKEIYCKLLELELVKENIWEKMEIDGVPEIWMELYSIKSNDYYADEVYYTMIKMKTQIENEMFIKYGFKTIDIKRQVRHWDLENDPDI